MLRARAAAPGGAAGDLAQVVLDVEEPRQRPGGVQPQQAGQPAGAQRGGVAGFETPFLVVDVDHANLRAGPSLTALVIVSEPYNTRLALRGTDGPWVHVETSKGVVGWMMRSLTRPG